MMFRILGEDIDLRLETAPSLRPIMADCLQIEQVIMNLAVNARDAMPQEGKLTIETANMDVDREYALRHYNIEQGHYVMLAISDSGQGIHGEIMDKIFEPFLTTKERGHGTGLGLAFTALSSRMRG
jgi:signal transduction histidine kinase